MDKEELLKKLVDAFHYEMDWESKENIDSAMTLCLPIIEEYAQSKVNNSVLDDVIICHNCKGDKLIKFKIGYGCTECGVKIGEL